MDPAEQYQRINDAVKVIDLYAAAPDKQEFINHLVADRFVVKDASLSRHATIWDHMSVFNSDSNPDHHFSKAWLENFKNYNVPARLFWKDYVDKIHNHLDYLASARPQIEEYKSQVVDNIVRNYAQQGRITQEQLAAYHRMNSRQKGDFIDHMLKGKPQSQLPYGAYASVKVEPEQVQTTKGIQGAKGGYQVSGPEVVTNQPTSKGIQGAKEVYTISHPEISTTPRRVLIRPGEAPIMPETTAIPGLEVIRADETAGTPNPGHEGLPLAQVVHKVAHPSPQTREVLKEAAFQTEMGLIKARRPLEQTARDLARGFTREIASIPFGAEPPPTGGYYGGGGGPSIRGTVGNVRGAFQNARNLSTAAKNAKKVSEAVRLAAFAAKQAVTKNPIVIAVIVIFACILLLVLMPDNLNILQNTVLCGPDTPCGNSTTATNTSNVVLLKNGPNHVDCCGDIDYNISVNYNGPGTADATVVDTLPDHTTVADPHGGTVGTDGQGHTTVTWTVTGVVTGIPQVLFLTITPGPETNNTWIINSVTGTVNLHFVSLPTDGDFETLLRGQGRNVNILGDLTTFLATVYQNNPDPRLAGRQDIVTQIYNTAVASNVNPLIILTLWGEESGYSTTGASLGCDPHVGGFPGITAQIGCGVNTMNHWLTDFEQHVGQDGTYTVTGSLGPCTFDDATIYAMERYGPVCLMNDGNSHFHANFASIFRQFLGY